ncbi:MAG: hypothetical protein ABI435_10180 [Pseudolysinimonas sp.]
MYTAPSDEQAYADEFPPVDASRGEFSQHAGVEFFDNFHDWVTDIRGANLRIRRHVSLDAPENPSERGAA